MLSHRLRRRANIKTTLGQSIVFSEKVHLKIGVAPLTLAVYHTESLLTNSMFDTITSAWLILCHSCGQPGGAVR